MFNHWRDFVQLSFLTRLLWVQVCLLEPDNTSWQGHGSCRFRSTLCGTENEEQLGLAAAWVIMSQQFNPVNVKRPLLLSSSPLWRRVCSVLKPIPAILLHNCFLRHCVSFSTCGNWFWSWFYLMSRNPEKQATPLETATPHRWKEAGSSDWAYILSMHGNT